MSSNSKHGRGAGLSSHARSVTTTSGRNPRACQRCRSKRIRCQKSSDGKTCRACAAAGCGCVGRNNLIFKMSDYVHKQSQDSTSAGTEDIRMNDDHGYRAAETRSNSPSTGYRGHGRADGSPLATGGHVHPTGAPTTSPSSSVSETTAYQPSCDNLANASESCPSSLPRDRAGSDHSSFEPRFHSRITPVAGDGTVIHRDVACGSAQDSWALTRDDVDLLRYFNNNLAPWFDYCDTMKHFESEVVSLAAEDQTLLYAILAVSAKHKSRQAGYDDGVGDFYQRCCLDLSIPRLDAEQALLSQNLLATALILRFFEEMTEPIEDSDSASHTLSVQLFLRMKRGEVGKSSFSDAAFLVMLRQEIFIANLLQRPFQPFTEHCNIDMSLNQANDATWTARIIAFAAEITNFAYQEETRSRDEWKRHARYLEHWKNLRPPSFRPILREQHEEQMFPTIVFIADLQLAAFQYQKLCELLLVVLDPGIPLLGLDRLSRRDYKVKAAVREICGAAIADNTWFPAKLTAGLAIAMCGDLFHDKNEQAQLLEILLTAEKHLGWPRLKVTNKLRQAWAIP